MKNILLVTDSIPFPPKNGKQLPIFLLFSSFIKIYRIHICIIYKNDKPLVEDINYLLSVGFYDVSVFQSIKEIDFFKYPGFTFWKFDSNSIRNYYKGSRFDFVWVSPIYLSSILLKNIIHYNKSILGLNDVKTFMYREGWIEIWRTKIWDSTKFFQFLRSFLMGFQEPKILNKYDFVHVQTLHEENKIEKLFNLHYISRRFSVIVGANSVKNELFELNYDRINVNTVLLMSQINGGRINETKWFVSKVWPLIIKAFPNLRLIIVGKSDGSLPDFLKNVHNLEILGFVDNLSDLYKSIDIAVVPTFHGTGLINRILDSFCAGVPVITTSRAAATFPSIKFGEELLVADEPKDYLTSFGELVDSSYFRNEVSRKARIFAKNLPNHEFVIQKFINHFENE
ncbi:Glycosyltransferase involved in cell wall bisynthesis [Algoriphagus locisalis]|uniref:Glycosyltransferase involved in cell wall bisynthesis n=1 Tax=Algoriphagus locisalis TaxID=305507 RepID=A0A1I6Y5Y9_9BACT|nr:glycosyltransferase [Algoriphagus locisalis]SFT45544.1 Glycosyltransferase involved in cell wall bisynthesis [Algoriphagus locisalis]